MRENTILLATRCANLIYAFCALANVIFVLSGGRHQVLVQELSLFHQSNPHGLFAILAVVFSCMIISGSLYIRKRWGKYLATTGVFFEFCSWSVESIMLAKNHVSEVPLSHPAHATLLALFLLLVLNGWLIYLYRSNK